VDSNVPLILGMLTALAGAETTLSGLTSSFYWRLTLQNVEQRRCVFSPQYMYRITLQHILLANTDKYSSPSLLLLSHV